ncbi:MAG: zinc ribbon domain-containing protein [Acidiferrobacterales bacterium]
MRAQEEKLYEAYLTARRDQAADSVRIAKSNLAHSPKDNNYHTDLVEAEAALKTAEAELTAQTAKSAEAEKMVEVAKAIQNLKAATANHAMAQTATDTAPAQTPPPVKASSAIHAKVEKPARTAHRDPARTDVKAEKTARIEQAKLRAEQATHNVQSKAKARIQAKTQKAARAALAKARAEQSARARIESELRTQQLAQAAQALKAAQAQAEKAAQSARAQAEAERAARERVQAEQAATAAAAQAQHELAQRKAAEKAFHAAQAAKAEQALKAAKAGQHAGHNKPGAAFRAAQAARAEQIVSTAKSADTKECPNCTASVASAAKSCRCGFSFPAGITEMPVLALSPSELAELLGNASS